MTGRAGWLRRLLPTLALLAPAAAGSAATYPVRHLPMIERHPALVWTNEGDVGWQAVQKAVESGKPNRALQRADIAATPVGSTWTTKPGARFLLVDTERDATSLDKPIALADLMGPELALVAAPWLGRMDLSPVRSGYRVAWQWAKKGAPNQMWVCVYGRGPAAVGAALGRACAEIGWQGSKPRDSAGEWDAPQWIGVSPVDIAAQVDISAWLASGLPVGGVSAGVLTPAQVSARPGMLAGRNLVVLSYPHGIADFPQVVGDRLGTARDAVAALGPNQLGAFARSEGAWLTVCCSAPAANLWEYALTHAGAPAAMQAGANLVAAVPDLRWLRKAAVVVVDGASPPYDAGPGVGDAVRSAVAASVEEALPEWAIAAAGVVRQRIAGRGAQAVASLLPETRTEIARLASGCEAAVVVCVHAAKRAGAWKLGEPEMGIPPTGRDDLVVEPYEDPTKGEKETEELYGYRMRQWVTVHSMWRQAVTDYATALATTQVAAKRSAIWSETVEFDVSLVVLDLRLGAGAPVPGAEMSAATGQSEASRTVRQEGQTHAVVSYLMGDHPAFEWGSERYGGNRIGVTFGDAVFADLSEPAVAYSERIWLEAAAAAASRAARWCHANVLLR